MYLDYFGLKELPFSIAPDPRYLYMSERHREALAHLLFGVGGQGGFVVLTGEVGTGKTTICRCFLNQVPANTDVAFVINPKLSARELLASICDELSIAYADSASIKVLNDAINRYLLDAHSNGRHTVLIVDEAQNLRVDVLEQLRLLTNLETSEKKLLQIILLGQPELKDMLAQSELRQLAQRVTARYHLDALNRIEVGAYLKCRLSVAGRASTLFNKHAVQHIFKLSGGIPRLINLIADRALLGAYASHSEFVEAAHVKQAYREIQGDLSPKRTSARQIMKYIGIAASVSLVVGTFWWGYESFYKSIPLIEVVSMAEEQHEAQQKSEPLKLPTRTTVTKAIEADEARIEVATVSKSQRPASAEDSAEERYIEGFEAALGQSGEQVLAYREATSPALESPQDINQVDSTPALEKSFPFLETLSERRDNDKSLFQAYQSIYKLWGVFYPEEPFMLACEFAQLNDLKCLHKQGNWRSLLRLDRPAILSLLNAEGEKLVIALLRIEGERARVAHNGQVFWVTMDEVDRHWLGEYSVLYRLPPYRSRTVVPGEANEEQWLRDKFQRISDAKMLTGFEANPSRNPLPEVIEHFQKAVGLVPDGIAGSMTIIHLNTVLNAGSPSLLGKG